MPNCQGMKRSTSACKTAWAIFICEPGPEEKPRQEMTRWYGLKREASVGTEEVAMSPGTMVMLRVLRVCCSIAFE